MLLKKLINFLFRFKKGLFYIQNNISLPEPLSETDEVIYVKKCMEGSIEARNDVVEHNMRLVVFIAKKFESRKVLLEDLISIGSMGFQNSIIKPIKL
jgi:RNA polymerase sporulation-specific sigma factor